MRTDITMPRRSNWKNLVVSSSIVLDPKDFQSKVELKHGAKTYSSIINYNIANMAGKGLLDITYPGRHIVTSLTGAKKDDAYSGRMISRWDADVDNSKKMIIDGRVNTDINNLEGHVKISHPARIIRVMFDQKITGRRYASHGEVSWGSGKKLAIDTDLLRKVEGSISRYDGTVRFISPFENFEHFKIHAGHKDDGRSIETTGDFSWAPTKTVSLKANVKRNRKWSNADIGVILSTPFNRVKEAQMQTTYKITNDGITSSLSAEMNNHKIELQTEGTANILKYKHDIKGSVSMKSSFEQASDATLTLMYKKDRKSVSATSEGILNGKTIKVEVEGENKGTKVSRDLTGKIKITTPSNRMELAATHQDNGNQYTSTLNGNLDEKEISTTVKMTHSGSGTEFENNGNIQISTTFDNARTISATWNGENKNGKANGQFELEHNGERMTASLEGRHKGSSWGRRLMTKIMVKPLYHPTRYNSQFSLKYNRKGAETSFNLARNGKSDVDVSAMFENDESKIAKIELKTGIDKFRDVAAIVSIKTSGQPATAQAEVKWDTTKKIVVETSWVASNGRHKVDASISTPFENYERMMVTAENVKTTGKCTTTAQVEYGRNKKIEFSLIHENGRINVEAQTPCPWFRSLSGTFELSTSPEFKTSTRVLYIGKQRIFQESSFSYDSEKIVGSVQIQTPFDKVKDIKATFSSQQESKFNIDINNEHNIQGTMSTTKAPGQFALSSTVTSTFAGFKKMITIIDHKCDSESITNKISHEAHIAGEYTKLDTNLNVVKSGKKKIETDITFTSSLTEEIKSKMTLTADTYTYYSKLDANYGRKSGSFNAMLNTEDKIRAQLMVTSPFEVLPKLSATFDHDGSLNDFKCDAEIDYSEFNGKVEGHLIFKNQNGDMKVNVNVNTPFEGYRRASAGIRHKATSDSEYDTTILGNFFAQEKVKVQSQLKLVSLKELSGTVTVTTTFEPIKRINFVFSHSCAAGKLSNHVQYERNNHAKVKLDIDFSAENDISGKATLQSHFKGAEFIEAAFTHKQPGDKSFEHHAEVSYSKNDKIEGDISFSLNPDMRATVTFKSPFSDDFRAEATHSGNLKAFRCHGEYTFGAKKGNGDFDFSLISSNINIKMRLDGGCKYSKDTSLTFSSEFNKESVKNTIEMKYYHGKIDSVVNVDFGKDLKLYSTLKTPYCKDIEATFTHEGETSDFKTSGKVIHGKDTYSSEVMFKHDKSTEMEIELVAPQFEKVTANMKNRLMQRRMNTDITASYGEKTFELDSNIRFRPNIDVTMNLKTPFEEYKDNIFTLGVNYDTNEFNFNSKLTQMNSVKFTAGLKASKNPLSLDFNLISPVPHLEAVTLSLKHTGDLFDFKQGAELKIKQGTFSYSGVFKKDDNIMGEFKLSAPKKDLILQFSHRGTMKNFKNSISLTGPFGSITYEGTFTYTKNLDGSFLVTTPFSKVGSVQLLFTHAGDMRNFRNSLSLVGSTFGTTTYEGSLTGRDRIQGKFQLSTPIKKLNNLELSFDHQGNLMDFRHTVTAIMPAGTVTYQGSFAKGDRIQGTFILTTPFEKYESFSVNFQHDGSLMKFRHGIDVTGAGHKYGYQGSFTSEPILGDFMVTADSKDYKLKFEQSGQYGGNVNLKAAGDQIAYVAGDLTLSPKISVSANIQTILPYLENWSAKYSQDIRENSHAFHGELAYKEQKGTADLQLNHWKSATVTVTTPFSGYETFSYVGKYDGKLEEFETEHQINSFLGEIKFEADFHKDPLDASFSLKTPFKYAKSWSAGAKYNKEGSSRKAHGEVQYNGKKTSMDVEVNTEPKQVKISWTSPFENFEEITYNGGIEGTLKEFKFNNDLSYTHGKVEVSGEFDLKPLSGKLQITTPYDGFGKMNSNFRYTHNKRAINGNAVLRIPMGKFRLNGEFNYEPKTMKITIQSPFKPVKELNIVASTDMSEGIQANLDVDRNDEKEVHVEIKMKNGPTQTLNAAFDSKYTSRSTVTGNAKSAKGMIEVDGKITYGPETMFDSSVIANLKNYNDIIVTYKLHTAFKYLQNIQLITEHKLDGYNVKNKLDIAYAAGKHIKYTTEYTHGEQQKVGKITLTTPFKDFESMSVGFTHTGTLKNFRDTANVNYLGTDVVKADASFSMDKKIAGSLSVENPFQDISLRFNHEGDYLDFENSATFDYGKVITFSNSLKSDGKKTSYSFSLSAPCKYAKQISGKLEQELTDTQFTRKAEFTYAPGKVIREDMTISWGETKSGTYELTTPFENARRFKASYNLEGTIDKFNGNAEVQLPNKQPIKTTVSFSKGSKATLSATLGTPFAPVEDVTLNVQHKGGLQNFENEVKVQLAPNKIVKAETSFSVTAGKVVLKTPFEKVGDALIMYNHEGTMKKFNNNAELQVIGRTYKGESTFSLDTKSGTLSFKSPKNELKLDFSHEGNWKEFSNNVVLTLNGKSYSGQSSFSKGSKITGSGTVNTPSRAVSVSFNHEGKLSNFKTDGEVKYGPSESIRAEVAFSHDSETDGNLKIITPFEKAKSLEMKIHHEGGIRNFKVSSNVAHNVVNTFSVKADHACSGFSNIRSNIEIKSSLEKLQELSATLQHYNDGLKKVNSNVNVVFNAATVVDGGINHSTDTEGVAGAITIRHPVAISCNYDIKKTEKEISGKVAINKKYQVIFSHKDSGDYYTVRRNMVLQSIIPSRTMMFKGDLIKSATRFMKSGTFAWNARKGQQVSYLIDMEDRSRSYQESYTTKARLDTPMRSFESTLTHEFNSGTYTTSGDFQWDAIKDKTKAVTVKNVYHKSGTVHKNEVFFKAPGMTRVSLVCRLLV